MACEVVDIQQRGILYCFADKYLYFLVDYLFYGIALFYTDLSYETLIDS